LFDAYTVCVCATDLTPEQAIEMRDLLGLDVTIFDYLMIYGRKMT
jgi:hypothetical protein